jgi:hypothetical protein
MSFVGLGAEHPAVQPPAHGLPHAVRPDGAVCAQVSRLLHPLEFCRRFKDEGNFLSHTGSARTILKNFKRKCIALYTGTVDSVLKQCCGAGAARNRIIWSEPEPRRDAVPAPAPTAPAPTIV